MLAIFRFLQPWRWSIAILMLLVFFQVLSDLFLPTLMADIIDKGVLRGDTDFILQTGGMMLLITFFSILCAVVASWISAKVAAGFGQSLRNAVFSRVSDFSLHEFDQFGASTLITRATNDVTQVQMVTLVIARMLLMAPMLALGGLIMAYSKDPSLTWVLAVAVPALVGMVLIIARKAIPLFTSIQVKIDRLNVTIRESLSGVRVIRAFNRVDHEQERFHKVSHELADTYIDVNRLMAFMMPGLMLIMNLTTLAVLWFGFKRIEVGTLQLGSLIAFTQYAMQILFGFIMMSMMFNILPRAQAAAVRIDEVLQVQPGIRDPLQAQHGTGNSAVVEFKSVDFRYPGAEALALKNISFRAEPGQVTAIIGSTGAGKSTLIRMIPRFYDVERGSVAVGGIDTREYAQHALRHRIGYVPQQAMLFSGSVKRNLSVANPEASEEDLTKAASAAQALTFIQELGGAWEHTLQQGGRNLSGGQKQRLAIARALSRKADVFLFDDSFSALDFTTDARLRAALKKELKDATVIIVAQRVGTVMDADQILVMDEGQIVGRGTHGELLANCQTYKEIVDSQLRVEDVA